MAITIDFPGVEVIDQGTIVSVVSPYNMCLMLGSTASGVSKVLTPILDLADFRVKFGTGSASDLYVEHFFENRTAPSVQLMFYRVNANSLVTPFPPIAATLADFEDALEIIDPTFNPGGILILPECFTTFTASIDRATIGGVIDTFCTTDNDSYWICYADLPLTISTAAAAVTASNDFVSNRGNISVYQPYLMKDTVKVQPSAAMAAIALSGWASGQFYNVPAGFDKTIKPISITQGYKLATSDLTLFHANGINAIRQFPGKGLLPFDSITLSPSEDYFQITSVVCFKVVVYLLELELLPYIHLPISGTTDTLISVEAALNRILRDAWVSGYLAGDSEFEAYEVKSKTPSPLTPGNSILIFEVAIRPSFALQKIRIELRNKLGVAIG